MLIVVIKCVKRYRRRRKKASSSLQRITIEGRGQFREPIT
jgi:hypothetical protein